MSSRLSCFALLLALGCSTERDGSQEQQVTGNGLLRDFSVVPANSELHNYQQRVALLITSDARCTGVAINKATIATAKHCFKSPSCEGLEILLPKLGKVTCKQVTFPTLPRATPGQDELDLALIQVSVPMVFSPDGALNLLSVSAEKTALIIGYQNDKPVYSAACKGGARVQGAHYTHTCTTAGGLSGAPIFIQGVAGQKTLYLAGLHLGHSSALNSNYALLLSEQVKSLFNSNAPQDAGENPRNVAPPVVQPTTTSPTTAFDDIQANPFHAEITEAHALSLLGELSSGRLFKPQDRISRQQYVKLSVELMQKLVPGVSIANSAPTQKPFSDVPTQSPGAAELAFAKAQGLISGDKEDGRFRPSESLTRAEAILIAKKLAENVLQRRGRPGALEKSEQAISFSDLTTHWAKGPVEEMSAYCRAASAHAGTAFRPEEPAQKDFAVAVLIRVSRCLNK